jgi:hypothetical protein
VYIQTCTFPYLYLLELAVVQASYILYGLQYFQSCTFPYLSLEEVVCICSSDFPNLYYSIDWKLATQWRKKKRIKQTKKSASKIWCHEESVGNTLSVHITGAEQPVRPLVRLWPDHFFASLMSNIIHKPKGVPFALLSVLETTAIDLSASYSSKWTSSELDRWIERAVLVTSRPWISLKMKISRRACAQFFLFCLTTLNLLPPPLY